MHTLIAAHPIPAVPARRNLSEELDDQFSIPVPASSSGVMPKPPPRGSWNIDGNGRPKFFVGQWLDAKDTVNQWLEATVLKVAVRPNTGLQAQQRSGRSGIRRKERKERMERLRGSCDSDNSDASISDILSDLDDDEGGSIEESNLSDESAIPSILVHYNGWPARWDEWILPDSSRLAPFRTRTTHPSTQPHVSPSPASNVTNSPSTGADDVRVILPQIVEMMGTLQGALVTLKDLCEDQGEEREADMDTLKLDETDTGTYISPFVNRVGSRTRDASGGGISLQTEDRNRDIRSLSQSLSPLADRFGRLMADMAPHLARLAANPTCDISPSAEAEAIPSSNDEHPLTNRITGLRTPRQRVYNPDSGSLSSSAPSSSGGIESILRGGGAGIGGMRVRPRSPSPSSTFRLLVSSPVRTITSTLLFIILINF